MTRGRNRKDEEDSRVEVPTHGPVEVHHSTHATVKITPFDGNGFRSWKLRMVAVLEEYDLDGVVITPSKETPVKSEKKRRALIKLHLADNILSLMEGKNATEIWKTLCATYERSGTQLRIHCWHTLCSLQFDDDKESLNSFVTRFEICSQQLRSSGARIDEVDIVSLFLYTLPSSFDSVVDALQTLSEEKMTMELVKNRLLNFELKRKTKLKVESMVQDARNSVAFLAGSSNADQGGNTVKCDKCGKSNHLGKDCFQSRLKCHKCGKIGHIRSNCPEKRVDTKIGENSDRGNDSSDETPVAYC